MFWNPTYQSVFFLRLNVFLKPNIKYGGDQYLIENIKILNELLEKRQDQDFRNKDLEKGKETRHFLLRSC